MRGYKPAGGVNFVTVNLSPLQADSGQFVARGIILHTESVTSPGRWLERSVNGRGRGRQT